MPRMFPLKPPDVPDDIWELEQPSILGLAHPGTPAAGGTPSPRSSASLISVDDSLSPNPDPTFDTEESTCLVPPTTEAQLPTSADTLFQEWNAAYYQTWLQLDASFIHGPTPSGSPTSAKRSVWQWNCSGGTVSHSRICGAFWICCRTKQLLDAGTGFVTTCRDKSASLLGPLPSRTPPVCRATRSITPGRRSC